ncbi:YdcF family protein, partial [Candidatus Nomurabacteria bacterium]|nr:YdcF family protein [Candidatus Nomurabacteria bacterium]
MFATVNKLSKFLKWCIFVLVVFVIVTNLIIIAGSSRYRYEKVEDAPEKQTALILGAAVYRKGVLSPVYQKRVDKAIELYQGKKVSKILASGDNSTIEHNEVNPVKNILIARGIPEEDVFLDHAGFDTYSTMYRARDIFQVSSIIIVTQPF